MLKNAFLLLLLAGSSLAWWDGSFPYRTPVTITNAGSALSDYQVNITTNTQALITAGKMRSDCADLRVVDSNDSAQLPFWIESGCNTGTTKIWVKVPAIQTENTTVYMYHGNLSAMSQSSTNATFVRVIDGGQPVRIAWNFDENTGVTTADSTGNGDTGTLYNAPSWVTGRYGNALKFVRASSQHINGSYLMPSGNSPRTISLWINITNYPSSDFMSPVSYGEAGGVDGRLFELLVDSGGILIAHQWGDPSFIESTGTVLSKNTWYHVVYMYDGTNVLVYINNVSKLSVAKSINTEPKNGLNIGCGYGGGGAGRCFDGLVDQVRVYNRTLTALEISDIFGYYGYTTPNYLRKELIRKYTPQEPMVLLGSEQQQDTTPPWIQIQSPQNQTYTTSNVNVAFTATDDIAVDSCAVRLNGTLNSSTCSNYTLTLANGAYVLNASANDTAGNTNSSQISFTVATASGPQTNTTQATTDASGIAAGNITFAFTPGVLKIEAGGQELARKTIGTSTGVNKIEIRARLTTKGQTVAGKQVTYTVSE